MGTISEIEIQGNQEPTPTAGAVIDAHHPFISHYQDVVGGEPVITGTRITVRAVVEYDRLYNNPERTLRALPRLSLLQIQDALGYYHDPPIEIERLIAENENVYEAGASKL